MKTIQNTLIFTVILGFSLILLSGCGADESSDSPQFSKDEIASYAKKQTSNIVSDFYTKGLRSIEDVVVSNMNYWFESDITLHVSCVVFYTIDTESELIGKRKLEKQYTLTFQVNEDVDTIEKTVRYVSINPKLELNTSDILG